VQGANSRKVTTTKVISEVTHSAAGKTTPVDADELPVVDTAASDVLKKLTWANVKATLKTYFDTLYAPGAAGIADGDKGDIVVSASGATWQFDSGVVTAAAKTVLDDTTTAAMRTTLGVPNITVASTAPSSPATGDVWIDTT
jgi:hypothetical protein